MTEEPIPEGLPASLVDVAEMLGLRVALSLIQHFGGTEVKFPKRPSLDHPVILALGETDGHALCQFLGGMQVYIPHARPGALRLKVRELEAQGVDRARIARALGISQRHVRRVANDAGAGDARQLDLFRGKSDD